MVSRTLIFWLVGVLIGTISAPIAFGQGIQLQSPIQGHSPYDTSNPLITSVFDHHTPRGDSDRILDAEEYVASGQVLAFSGERGDRNCIIVFRDLCGLKKADGTVVTLDGLSYYASTGSSDRFHVWYDGHPGIDFAVVQGTDVVASAAGTVVEAAFDSSLGNYIKINHGNDWYTLYLHLSNLDVTEGESVSAGAVIGQSGCTGTSCGGPHLHFQVRRFNSTATRYSVDPYGFQGQGALWASAPSTHTLSVSINGQGSVQTTSGSPSIHCPTVNCSASYTDGTSVTLSAANFAGWTFSGWSGACSGTGTCTVSMTQARNVTATFAQTPVSHTLGVQITGSGTVTSSPSGINCPSANCSASFAQGTSVTLSAASASGWTFSGWSGACSGTGTCTVSMTQARNVTATFVEVASTHTLSVSINGQGSVQTTSGSPSIHCPTVNCSASYTDGTSVTLSAANFAGWTFSGWSGACSGTGTCTVSMTQARNVTATFAEAPSEFAINVVLEGDGVGAVSSEPSGIDCGAGNSVCESNFPADSQITLTAAPAPGTIFSGWTGYCLGQAGYTCSVPMTADRQVGAVFNTERLPPRLVSMSRNAPPFEFAAADSVTWRLEFDEPVENVSPADFVLSGTSAGLSVAPVASYIFDVTASGGDLAFLDGMITLGFASGQDIADRQGNPLSDTTPTRFAYDWFRMDHTRPTPVIFAPAAINTLDPFIVGIWFAEPVLFFTDIGDVVAFNAGVNAPTGTGQNYFVTVSPYAESDVFVGVPPGVASDRTYVNTNIGSLSAHIPYDATPPVLTSIARLDPADEVTNADTLTWRVTFSEGVTNVDAAEFSVSGSTAGVSGVSRLSSSTYDVTVSGGDLATLQRTEVGLSMIAFHDVHDVAGNRLANPAPAGAHENYTVHNAAGTLIAASVSPSVANAFLGGPDVAVMGAIYAAPAHNAEACRIALPSGAPVSMSYRLLDGAGAPAGAVNPLFDIPAGTTVGYAMTLTPSALTGQTGADLFPVFRCGNAVADTVRGFNSLRINVGETAPPRIVSFPFSSTFDGVVRISSSGGLGIMSTIGVNIGEGDGSGADRAARITTSVDTGGTSLPLGPLLLCQTNPATGGCISALGSDVTSSWPYYETSTFGIFVYDDGSTGIPLDPANARLFVRYSDAGGVVRAIDSLPVTAPAPAAANAAGPIELPAPGRYAVAVRQPADAWPILQSASLFVAPDGQAFLDDGNHAPHLLDLSVLAESTVVDIARNRLRFGDANLTSPGDFRGIRDARSDVQLTANGAEGIYGSQATGHRLTLSTDGSLSGIVAGCLARGRLGQEIAGAAGLRFGHVELMGCDRSGLYRTVIDTPTNDNAPLAIIVANDEAGWRLAQ